MSLWVSVVSSDLSKVRTGILILVSVLWLAGYVEAVISLASSGVGEGDVNFLAYPSMNSIASGLS